MDQWDTVTEVYKLSHALPPAVQGMIDLIDYIRDDPRFEDVQAGVAGPALTLGYADRKRRVHASWERPWVYAVFLDFCEHTFYGARVEVEIEAVVSTILDYLHHVHDDPDEA